MGAWRAAFLSAVVGVAAGGCSEDIVTPYAFACDSRTDCAPGFACRLEASRGVRVCQVDVGPTCDDGEQNGQETGVDCGGSCGACESGELAAPSLVEPVEAAVVAVGVVILDWADVPGAASYDVFVDASAEALTGLGSEASCATCLVSATVTESRHEVPAGVLNAGTTYHWTVRAKREGGAGPAAVARSFAMAAADACSVQPCGANAKCDADAEAESGRTCTCEDGYEGNAEEGCTDVDDCEPDPCVHGSCADAGANEYACDCGGTGYEGATCATPVCETPCANGGVCSAPDTCDCAGTGYSGTTCATPVCETPCANGGVCSAPDTCDCEGTGYDGATCATPVCDTPCDHGTCSAPNTCDCEGTGYDGATCATPVCDTPCDHGTCSAPDTCDCEGTGYDGATCATPVCETACANGGSCSAPNTCDCAGTGFAGASCSEDVNDCEPDPCHHGGLCADAGANSFTCDCAGTGYDGTICDADVNECDTENGGCEQVCANTDGGFECACELGYSLAPNGRACVDVDECSDDPGICGEWATCENTAGSHVCHCKPGIFDVNGDGSECLAVTQVATGSSTTCAIMSDGRLYCWGRDRLDRFGFGPGGDFGGDRAVETRPRRMGAALGWSAASVGETHICGILNGELHCWGNNSSGQLGFPSEGSTATRVGEADDWMDVSNGATHSCGIRSQGPNSGELYCWGSGQYGELGNGESVGSQSPIRVGNESDWETVRCGTYHTCGIRSGELFCWGDPDYGRLGLGDDVDPETPPTQVGIEIGWEDIALTENRTCGIRDGTLWCWGWGYGSEPQQIGSDEDWNSIDVSIQNYCGIKGGDLVCWGENYFGGAGLGHANPVTTPTVVGEAGVWSNVALGENSYGCGVASGGLRCWGQNFDGQLGLGSATERVPMTQVGSADDWTRVAVYQWQTCGMRGTDAYCWGREWPPSATMRHGTPELVDDGSWEFIESGSGHTCGLSDGKALCWGSNSAGQLGGGQPLSSLPAGSVLSLSVGNSHTCAVVSPGDLYCWGYNSEGQLGDGTQQTRYQPVRIGSDSDWTFVEAGGSHTCGLRGHDLYCWGSNSQGLLGLGDGTGPRQLAPQRVGTASDWTSVSLHNNHSCGLRGAANAGTLYCWGSNFNGQLGLSDTTLRNVPTQVGDDHDWSMVDAGDASCGLRDHVLYCWGDKTYGQLLDEGPGVLFVGGDSAALTPRRVSAYEDWTAVSAGQTAICAVRGSGLLYCWGDNQELQLGIGDTYSPTLVDFSVLPDECGATGAICPFLFACSAGDRCQRYATDEVWIPPGDFWMGCNNALDGGCASDEEPRRLVSLAGYAIDTTEVRSTDFSSCVAAGACSASEDDPSGAVQVAVTWAQAEAYCAWGGKPAGPQRLCTEAEWERAARGGCETIDGDCPTGMRTNPWGEAAPFSVLPKSGYYEGAEGEGWSCWATGAGPIGAYPASDSPYGLSDMVGNSAEWVADWYAPSYDGAATVDPTGPATGTQRVKRGGHVCSEEHDLRASARMAADPDAADAFTGFRCCRSLD